ncbi:response regulator [Glycomyces tenuis]|uniref:response regulator n=2 Tax=Glycomyces tenuis TaxID=58116 RepID=UPI000411AFF6|nr:response regulator [Glycomyces tenuis]
MTEAMWIELIRFLPTLVWLGFGIAALIVARRILTREAHRMTRVETPFVSVELAREVIEQASHTREGHPDAAQAVPVPFPPLPPLGDRAAEGADEERPGGTGLDGTVYTRPPAELPRGGPASPSGTPDGDRADEDPAEQEVAEAETEAQPGGETPPQPMYPPIPPQRRFPVQRTPYPATTEPPVESPRTVPMGRPPYRAPLPDPAADTQRGLRAATRLSLSTDLLQGGSVLWVDDHHEWNEPLVRLFRTAGVKVDTVDSTDEAMHAMTIAPYDLVISDMRRDNEPAGESAGMALLDRMVGAGIPTPAIFFSGSVKAAASLHPRAATATGSPEELVNYVIDIVGQRRHQYGDGKALRLPWGHR